MSLDSNLSPDNIRALEARVESLQVKVTDFERLLNAVVKEVRKLKYKEDKSCDDMDCCGCSCHINPPCNHCVDHVKYEE